MTRLPRPTGADLIAALARSGSHAVRVKGGQHNLRHADGRSTVVPAHAGETPGPGIAARIPRDCDLSAEALRVLL